MKILITEKNDETMRLVIREVNVSLMNALRRIILAEVPSMAIDELIVVENSSLLSDEILAHRLGLIPLKTDLDSYNLSEECTCGSDFGCNLCRVALTLDVEALQKVRTVYSMDLKPVDPEIKPVSESIPIAKLSLDQKIKLEAYARLGRGKKHAKWQPVSMSTYKYLPRVNIDEKRCDACGECVKICPTKILVKVEKAIRIQNPVECTLCNDCVKVCPLSPSAINITWEKDSFVFNLETTGVLLPERIFLEALNIFDKKLEDFLIALKKINGETK